MTKKKMPVKPPVVLENPPEEAEEETPEEETEEEETGEETDEDLSDDHPSVARSVWVLEELYDLEGGKEEWLPAVDEEQPVVFFVEEDAQDILEEIVEEDEEASRTTRIVEYIPRYVVISPKTNS